jgi:hypothetical protein
MRFFVNTISHNDKIHKWQLLLIRWATNETWNQTKNCKLQVTTSTKFIDIVFRFIIEYSSLMDFGP